MRVGDIVISELAKLTDFYYCSLDLRQDGLAIKDEIRPI